MSRRVPDRRSSACRIGVLLLLVMVLGAPYLHTDETLDLKPVVALIVDDSASMELPAGPFDPAEARALGKVVERRHRRRAMPQRPTIQRPRIRATDDATDDAWHKRLNAMSRSELLAAVLRAARTAVLEPLAEKFELKVYRVARRVRPDDLFRAPRRRRGRLRWPTAKPTKPIWVRRFARRSTMPKGVRSPASCC